MNVGGQRRQPQPTTAVDVQRKLGLGRERLEKADQLDGDPDLLGLALLSYHGALEDHLRIWVSRNPYVRAEYRQADTDKHNVTWRELRESLEDHGSLPYQLRDLPRFIKQYNLLRQPVGHGDRIQESANIRQYAELVEATIDCEIPCARVGGILSEFNPAQRGQPAQGSPWGGFVAVIIVVGVIWFAASGHKEERAGDSGEIRQSLDESVEYTSADSADLSSQEPARGDPTVEKKRKKKRAKRRAVAPANPIEPNASASAAVASTAQSAAPAQVDISHSELDALNSYTKGAAVKRENALSPAPGAKRGSAKSKVDVSLRELEDL